MSHGAGDVTIAAIIARGRFTNDPLRAHGFWPDTC